MNYSYILQKDAPALSLIQTTLKAKDRINKYKSDGKGKLKKLKAQPPCLDNNLFKSSCHNVVRQLVQARFLLISRYDTPVRKYSDFGDNLLGQRP